MKVASQWMAILVLLCGWTSAEQLSVLNFVILKDYNGKPIRNASVAPAAVSASRYAADGERLAG